MSLKSFKNFITSSVISFLTVSLLIIPAHAGKHDFGSSQEEDTSTHVTKPNSLPHLDAERLTTPQSHTQFLIDTLNTAENSVMITSHSVSSRVLFETDIARAIVDAARRRVKVYIYYKNLPWFPPKDYSRLQEMERYCERFEENDTHAKCVAKDRTQVAIGSHDWLSDVRDDSFNASWVISGGLAPGLIEDVWQGIRAYQSLSYDNPRGFSNFCSDRDASSTGAYQYATGQFLYTLRTPDAHAQLLEDEVFGKAQRQIVICSPFIRLAKLKQFFSHSRLQNLETRQIRTHLVTCSNPCSHTPQETKPVFDYLNQLSRAYRCFSFSKQNLHAKTIMVDDDLLCEGSFNLLSAVDDILHDANNFEMSVALRGDMARYWIAVFQQTRLGQAIMPKAPQPAAAAALPPSAAPPPPATVYGASPLPAVYGAPFPPPVVHGASPLPVVYGASFPPPVVHGAPPLPVGHAVPPPPVGHAAPPPPVVHAAPLPPVVHAAPPPPVVHAAPPSPADKGTKRKASELTQIPSSFNTHIEIFSGERFGKRGFCVRLDGSYIIDEGGKTAYFPFPEEARQTAYQVWLESTPQTSQPPASFSKHLEIFSGRGFGKSGYCVRLGGKYIRNARGAIVYFASPKEAEQEAYQIWSNNQAVLRDSNPRYSPPQPFRT